MNVAKSACLLGALLAWAFVPSARAISTYYMVFFEFGDATLSIQARRTIEQFFKDKSSIPAECLIVTLEAHLDAAETRRGKAVGDRRLAAVARYIKERTTKKYTIQAWNFGGSRQLVRTDDGAREPQNRRVVIDSRFSPDVRTERFNCIGGLCLVKAWLPDGTSCSVHNPSEGKK